VSYKVFISMALFGLLTLPLARAQLNRTVGFEIPFDFGFGTWNTVLPAGNYEVSYVPANNALVIRGVHQNAISIVKPVEANLFQQGKEKLVFKRYGNTYFLSQVFRGTGTGTGRQLPKSKSELDLISRGPARGVEYATIIVPAN